ncbi:hypothetical protein PHMEG_00033991 [Phytophthora megakarya]|uniref:Retrotransposon gag domain-containing protein n=1 Tax=Phytophthora megakarya TaxID=4795 RepID=A0A225US19_9STRA|nr:hypothetical protein PHMEG_00033991 [Phytophthora megakarya]
MKAPDDEEDDDYPGSGWSEEDPQSIYDRKELRDFVDHADPEAQADHGSKGTWDCPVTLANRFDATMELIRLLKDAGMTPGSFDADALFDLDLDVIQGTSRDLFQKFRILVGEAPQRPDPRPLTAPDAIDNLTMSTLWDINAGCRDPRSAALAQARNCRSDNGSAPTDQATVTESSDLSVGTLQEFFNAAMDRYLAGEREANKNPASTRPQHQGSQDVEMESIRSSDHGSRWEYDPDDVDFPTSAQPTMATAAAGSTGSTMIQRVRVSAISDLMEFTGRDQDEDRVRAWISKVKSAFMRDQASDDEKCLTFADLFAGSPKNWYRQLSRSTRNNWNDLLRSFQIQYFGLGVSGGNAKERREHVDHYIETLEDQDLAERLTLLRLTDADDLEEVLRARDRAKNRQKKAAFESSKYRQKPTNSTPSAPAKQVRVIQIQANDSGSDSESDGSGRSDSEHRKIFLAASEAVTPKVEKESANLDPRLPDRDQSHQDHNLLIHGNGFNRDRCSHCGSRKHSDLGCWRRYVHEVCRGCGEPHDMEKCPMEGFYNKIRQWFNPTKHMGMLPEAAEKMLN